MNGSLRRKQEITDRLGRGAKYDGQSLREAKISGLVYTLWWRLCQVCADSGAPVAELDKGWPADLRDLDMNPAGVGILSNGK